MMLCWAGLEGVAFLALNGGGGKEKMCIRDRTSIFLAAKLSYGEIIRNALVTLAVGAILLTGVIVWGKKKK